MRAGVPSSEATLGGYTLLQISKERIRDTVWSTYMLDLEGVEGTLRLVDAPTTLFKLKGIIYINKRSEV